MSKFHTLKKEQEEELDLKPTGEELRKQVEDP